jgi:hypothetical protein
MSSKQITDRQKSADSVIAAGETHAEEVAKALGAIAKRHLKKGQEVPDFALVVRILCAELTELKDAMVSADEAHEAELSDDPAVRKQRDDAAKALYDEVVQLREMLVGAYGGAKAAEIISGSTPDDPVVLARFAGEVAKNLEKTKLPAPRIKGAKLDAAELASSLRDKRARVEKALKDVQREAREAQVTLGAKISAVGAYDKGFAGAATALTGLLIASGRDDLAAKVKPSSRRPGQTAVGADEETAPAEQPPEK